MAETAANADRDAEILARVAELDLSAAERVHAKLMVAEETSELTELARGYQRMARSVRQSLLLKARLERQRAQAAREVEAAAEQARKGRVDALRARISHAVDERIDAEADDQEANDRLTADLDTWLEGQAMDEGFLDHAVATHIARACRRLGLTAPEPVAAEPDVDSCPAGRSTGEGDREAAEGAPPHRNPPDHPWRSSA